MNSVPRRARRLVVCALVAASPRLLGAQDTAYARWLDLQTKQYRDFQRTQDSAFVAFLERQWRLEPERRDTLKAAPKPRLLPAAPVGPAGQRRPAAEPRPEPPLEVVRSIPDPPPFRTPIAAAGDDPSRARIGVVPQAVPIPVGLALRSADVDYFGAHVSVRYAAMPALHLDAHLSSKGLAAAWDQISRAPYELLLSQATNERARLQLNDWGYCELLMNLAASVYPGDANRQTIATWFLLVKSGYDAKIGYANDRVRLLVSSATGLYNVPYVGSSPAAAYYVAPFAASDRDAFDALTTYDGKYPGATRRMDFRFIDPPHFGGVLVERRLSFEYDSRKLTITVPIERSLGEFLREYPRLEMDAYFGASMSVVARDALLRELRPMVEARGEVDAVQLVLRFVQTAFAYKTDNEQFGRDKPFFPDETLFYPYSDCEDRAVLFAYLVHALLGKDVIGLAYPNHIATGVRLSTSVAGKSVRYRDQDFVITDPTYVNADVGMVMPQFRDVRPDVIFATSSARP